MSLSYCSSVRTQFIHFLRIYELKFLAAQNVQIFSLRYIVRKQILSLNVPQPVRLESSSMFQHFTNGEKSYICEL